MKKIAINGAGGFGRETKLLIDQINDQSELWEFVGFFDDKIGEGVLGGMKDLNAYNESLNVVVAMANSVVRKRIVQQITNRNINFATLIHPSVVNDLSSVSIGKGSIITAYCVLTTDVKIGKHNIVNLSSTLGHDIATEDYCSIMPGVHLSGNVSIGEGVLIGTGARVLLNLSIGAWSKVGAGAVVIDDVIKRTTVVGVPAKEVIKNV